MTSTKRFGDKLFAIVWVRLIVWLAFSSAFLPGVLRDNPNLIASYHDEHNAILHEEVARRTMAEFHEVPAWNPYFCGGIVGLSNAPDASLAPDFLFRLIFGTSLGRRLTVLFFVMLGMEGAFRYARKHDASVAGSALAGIAFATSGHFVDLLRWGWIFMFNYNVIPWIALSFEVGLRSRAWRYLGSFFLGWLILGGGTYVIPYTGIMLAMLLTFETVRAIRKERTEGEQSVAWYRPLVTLIQIGIGALLFAAIRVLPLVSLLASHSRPVDQIDQDSPLAVFAMLAFSRADKAWHASAGEFYVGMWVALLALIALLFADKKAAKFGLIALVFAVFACGEISPIAPYLLLHKLPVYSQLRFPRRMLVICGLFVALASARGLTRLEDALTNAGRALLSSLSSRLPRLPRSQSAPDGAASSPVIALLVGGVTTALALFAAIYAANDVVEANKIGEHSIYTMDPPLEHHDDFKQARGNRWDAHIWPYIDRGSLHCFEEHKLFTSPYLAGDLAQEEYPAEGSHATVERLSWSPHRIQLRVKAEDDASILINQNHSPFWKSDVGSVDSSGGLLRVRVPKGEHIVTLSYRDWHVALGAFITLGTLMVGARFFGGRALSKGRAFFRLFRTRPRPTEQA